MTAYIDGTSGETYYAKPLPLSSSPSWGDDVVAATENGSTGQFAFVNDATKAYWVFLQAGGSPASSDVATHVVDVERASQASVNTIDGIVDNILLDTDELQSNQGNWLTATGFSTHDANDVVTAMQAVADDFKADTSGLSTLTAQQVWEYSTRSLTTFGSLVTEIATAVWGAATRTLTAASDSSGVTTLLSYITGTIRTATEDATAETAQTTAIRSGLATTTNVSDAQDAITEILGTPAGASIAADIAAIEGGGGAGARTVTITVNDGSTPLQNATVRLTEGANTFTASTNASGVATFNVDDAVYVVAITKSGYSFAGDELEVDGDETATYSMTLIVTTPAASPYCNVTIPVLDQYVTAAAGVMVEIEFIRFLPSATKTGVVVNHPPRVESDSEGLVEVRLARLARYKTTYQVENEAPKVVEFSTPDAGSFTVTG